ncbi:OmpA/MotB domain-containing protein [Candidatus Sulfopaludibacter sp. SbA6]|nr:OmpA/MotB domain-containing protein [Candidatus Sulfopaludibacter sp. SbA6]
MATKRLRFGWAWLLLLGSGCAPKQAPVPPPAPPAPPPKQSLVVLLPDPEGKPGGISVTNPAGTETLSQPYQAVRVERSDTAPTAPFAMDQAEVRRVFGAVLDGLPAPEVVFTLYFGEGSEALLPESQAQLPAILNAIRERRATAISVIGHTDTTADPQFNYRLGRRRAQGLADILRARGVDSSDLFVESHGDTDLAVQTARGVAERRNRRVEVIVR